MWKRLTSFGLSLPDRPGELANFVGQLETAGVNLLGLWSERGSQRICCVPESPAAFRTFFKDSGLAREEGQTFYVSDADRPGALVASLRRISEAGINIDSIESVASGKRFGCFLWADAGSLEALEAALRSLDEVAADE